MNSQHEQCGYLSAFFPTETRTNHNCLSSGQSFQEVHHWLGVRLLHFPLHVRGNVPVKHASCSHLVCLNHEGPLYGDLNFKGKHML